MATFVSVDAHCGTLQRYETGGTAIRRTHACTLGAPCSFTPRVVENFRLMPDRAFCVEPPPNPTNPPSAAGTARIAA